MVFPHFAVAIVAVVAVASILFQFTRYVLLLLLLLLLVTNSVVICQLHVLLCLLWLSFGLWTLQESENGTEISCPSRMVPIRFVVVVVVVVVCCCCWCSCDLLLL